MSFNWEDAVDNDSDELLFKKNETHADEVIEVKKPEIKLPPNPKQIPSNKTVEQKKEVVILPNLTPDEIEKKVREDDLNNFADMFEDLQKIKINGNKLVKEEDLIKLADSISENIKNCPRKQTVLFLKKLSGNIASFLRPEEVTEISNFYVELLNNKNSKKGGKKKNNEPPSMKKAIGGTKGNNETQLLQDFADEDDEIDLKENNNLHRGNDYDFDFM